LIKNCNLLFPGPPQRTPKLHEKPSALKREHPAPQNMKFLHCFLFLWVIFVALYPDPDMDPLTDLIESGSETLLFDIITYVAVEEI
jgi:hypothetical protein